MQCFVCMLVKQRLSIVAYRSAMHLGITKENVGLENIYIADFSLISNISYMKFFFKYSKLLA